VSFDLFFCREKEEPTDFSAVCVWAEHLDLFKRNTNQLWYENSETGVYFSFDYDAQPAKDPDESQIPAGFFDTGLSFNLNFNRPSYFGYEAMPIVEHLVTQFHLFVVNPQADSEEQMLIREVSAQSLLESWLDHNRRAIVTMSKDLGYISPLQMPLTQSIYRWNYAKAKKGLERRCGNDIFVPNVSLVRRVGSNQVAPAFVYTDGVPSLVPISDWVFIVRDRKQHFWSGKKTEVGVLSSTEFRNLTGEYLKDFDHDQLGLRVLDPASAREVSSLIQSCEFMFPRDEFEGVAPDGFVDIDLEVKSALN